MTRAEIDTLLVAAKIDASSVEGEVAVNPPAAEVVVKVETLEAELVAFSLLVAEPVAAADEVGAVGFREPKYRRDRGRSPLQYHGNDSEARWNRTQPKRKTRTRQSASMYPREFLFASHPHLTDLSP